MEANALIVEDDSDLANLFAEALRAAKFEPEIASDGRIAIERLGQMIPQVVVLDLNLPEVSGETLLKHIRTDPRLSQTYVILTSADSQTVQKLEGQADFALVKPVSFTQLRDLAARLHSPRSAG
jgi:DNA-binding response OmpR family regulator